MFYDQYSYVINHYNILSAKKKPSIKILFNRKTISLIKLLYNLGAIRSYIIVLSNNKKYILFSVLTFRSIPFFKEVRLVSTQSKKHNITLVGLKLLTTMSGKSIIILSTTKGLLTQQKAIDRKIGGLILCIIN